MKGLPQLQCSGLWNAYTHNSQQGQHPNVICCSCHVSCNHVCFTSKPNVLYTAPDRFSEPNEKYMNSASTKCPNSQQLWDPELVLTASMNRQRRKNLLGEDDDQEDTLTDLEPPRRFRPRPLSSRFGIYCTRNSSMHQSNGRAGHTVIRG